MAFPYLSEATFDDGTLGHFDVETDTESRLDFPHYTELARFPTSAKGPLMPYRGSYCVRVALENDGSPADAYLQETGAWDTSAAGTIFFRFAFYLSPDTVMANTDEFGIFQLWSSTSTVEGGVYINYTTANGFRVGIGETAATQFMPLVLGKWHIMELKYVIDSGVSNNGTLDAWLDGVAYTQVASLDQGAITSGVFGVLSQDAGTTRGTLLLDAIISDDARIGPPLERWPKSRTLTITQQVFVGPGNIDAAVLLSTTAGESLTLYDTDEAETTNAQGFVLELAVGAFLSAEGAVAFKRGCYAVLAGTAPRASVIVMGGNQHSAGVLGPLYYGNDAAMRTWANRRGPRIQ